MTAGAISRPAVSTMMTSARTLGKLQEHAQLVAAPALDPPVSAGFRIHAPEIRSTSDLPSVRAATIQRETFSNGSVVRQSHCRGADVISLQFKGKFAGPLFTAGLAENSRIAKPATTALATERVRTVASSGSDQKEDTPA